MEHEGSDDEDDELIQASNKKPSSQIKYNEGAKHGKLVDDILKQKGPASKEKPRQDEEDDLGEAGKKITIQRNKPNRPEQKKVAPPVNLEDLENVKKSIQNLCQSTNPLGKSMEFVSDDIDSMKREFERWNSQYNQAALRMEEQKRVTEDELGPAYNKIAELEEQIKETQMKIRNTTAQILKNKTVINSYLSVFSKGPDA